MFKIEITGELLTQWFTEGERFPKTEITKGLPEGCLLRDARLRFAKRTPDELTMPDYQPVLELRFLEPGEKEPNAVRVPLTTICPEIQQWRDPLDEQWFKNKI